MSPRGRRTGSLLCPDPRQGGRLFEKRFKSAGGRRGAGLGAFLACQREHEWCRMQGWVLSFTIWRKKMRCHASSAEAPAPNCLFSASGLGVHDKAQPSILHDVQCPSYPRTRANVLFVFPLGDLLEIRHLNHD